MPQTKATKKFESKHLKDTLKKRKEGAKIKQKVVLKEKKKAKRAKEIEREEIENPKKKEKKEANGSQFEHMTVDEFFQGGFEIPEEPEKKKKKSNSKAKDVPAKSSKRKRTTANEDEDSDAESVEGFPVSEGEDSEAASDAEDTDHEQQLEALKEKDPEFYKYMKENDPELLDFETGDFDDLELSGDEEKPAKKRKTGKGNDQDSDDEADDSEVTKAMIAKWEKAMTEQKSLRALREVVLAFRSAAHLNEEDGKTYKYRVSNPDGELGIKSAFHGYSDILQYTMAFS